MPVKDIYSLTKEELIQQYMAMRDMLDQKSKEYNKLKQNLSDLQVNYNDLELKYKVQSEKYLQLIAAKYQAQKHTVILDMPTLFNDAEDEALKIEDEEAEMVHVEAHDRKKRVPKEKHIDYSSLPHEEEKFVTPEGSDICPNCGSRMKLKGYETKEELVVVPMKAYVRVWKEPIYECEKCQELNEDGKSTFVHISLKKRLFERSKCAFETLAWILDMKYSAGLPLETLEKQMAKLGVKLPKQNMCNWVLNSIKYLGPLFDLMKEDFNQMPGGHADETRTQVLNEEGKPATSTSYMWVYHSPRLFKPIVLYDYQDSRSGDRPAKFLENFKGRFLCTDAYQGYDKVTGDAHRPERLARVMCNVHAFRKFRDAYNLLGKGRSKK